MHYHLSTNSKLIELEPRIPSSACPMYEDIITPRICFAETIDGCLSSIGYPGEFYVYIPHGEYSFVKPTVNQVRDAKYTGEIWVLSPVGVSLIGKISANEYTGKKRFNSGRGRVTIYCYPYEWVEKIT